MSGKATSSTNKFLNPGEYFEGLASYLDEHRVYETFDFLSKELLSSKPDDPIPFLINLLKNARRATQVNRILVLGANPKDCEIYGRKIAEQFGLHRIRADRLKNEDEIFSKMKEFDDKGWTMTAYPSNPEEAFKILEKNVIISKIVILQPKEGWEDTGYHLFLSTLCDPFPRKLCTVLPTTDDEGAAYEKLIAQISSKAHMLDKIKPRPPPKVILYVSKESGYSMQGNDLSMRVGVPHIDMVTLVQDAAGNLRNSYKLLKSRLDQDDIKEKGFVLSLMGNMDIDIPTFRKILDIIPGKTQLLYLKTKEDMPYLERIKKIFTSNQTVNVDPEDSTMQVSQSLMLALEELL